MALHVASMIRNEADRFLAPALDAWNQFADSLIVLDDGSTDDSREICARAGAYVVDAEGGEVAWGREAPKRARLFDVAWDVARIGDYILVLDADMVPARNPRTLMSSEADAIFFVLFDLWSLAPLTYREDDFWQGHLHPRLWMVRKTHAKKTPWEWSARGVHCGHFPTNLTATSHAFAPRDFALLHHAYVTPELRESKYVAYASVASHLSEGEIAHARSILDDSPNTYALDFDPEYHLA